MTLYLQNTTGITGITGTVQSFQYIKKDKPVSETVTPVANRYQPVADTGY